MRILLDECVDRRLASDLSGHAVSTVPRNGWAGIKNGGLLALAEKEFDVFITVDGRLPRQQDLTKFKIAVVLLRAQTNRLNDLRPLVPRLMHMLTEAKAGELTVIGE